MHRSPFILDGRHFDLGHLAPMRLPCSRPDGDGPPLAIEATFSHHVYTVSASDHLADPEAHRVMERGDRRFFDPVRWRCSRDHLPGMVAALPSARVEFTWELRNYRYALGALLADGTEYALFFGLRRGGEPGCDLRLFVESAYPIAPGSRRRSPGSIRFGVLAMKTMRGEKVSHPPRR